MIFNYYRSMQLGPLLGIQQHTIGGGFYKTTLDTHGKLLIRTPRLHLKTLPGRT